MAIIFILFASCALWNIRCDATYAGAIKKPETEMTLYANIPDIQELFVSNFTQVVCRSAKAWAVQFYSATCGGCQRFLPVWRELADDISRWRRMVTLAAVPCSHPNNTIICRKHHIGAYPTIKYFPPSSADDFRGLFYECPENVTGLRMCMIDFLEGVVVYPIWWPRLQPFRTMNDLQKYIEENQFDNRTILIMFEELASTIVHRNYIAREVILDMTEHQRLLVARMLKQQGVNLGVTNFPSLYRLNHDHSVTRVAESLDRAGFVEVIERDVLGIVKNPDVDVTEASNVLPGNIDPIIPDGVHEQDLESGLYYTFWREIATKVTLTGPALDTLKKYVDILADLLPVSPPIKEWLNHVRAWLMRQNEVAGRDWTQSLDKLQTDTAYIPERVIWVGCLGSEPQYRGYRCSLWITFHTLLTAAHNASKHGSEHSAKNVLITIREFIRHFFLCRECRDHFLEMSANIKNEVHNDDEAVLWMWEAHNDVNSRLHGDITEDPRSPKMQFPIYRECNQCHETETEFLFATPSWHDDHVMAYLLSYYGADNVIRDSVPYNIYAGRSYYLTEAGALSKGPSLYVLVVFSLAIYCIKH